MKTSFQTPLVVVFIALITFIIAGVTFKVSKKIMIDKQKEVLTIEYELPFENYTPVISVKGTDLKISLADYYEIASTGTHFVKPYDYTNGIHINSYLNQDGVIYSTTLAKYEKPSTNLALGNYWVIDGVLYFYLIPQVGWILIISIFLIAVEIAAGWHLAQRIIEQIN